MANFSSKMSTEVEALPTSKIAVGAIIGVLRPRQWVKNAFVAAPLFFTPPTLSLSNVGSVATGVVSFCALASAIYIVNDYIDREADRKHPEKRFRPLAAGTIPIPLAFALCGLLAVIGFTIAFSISYTFTG